MTRDIFGLSQYGIEKRMRTEKKHAHEMAGIFSKIINDIKNTSDNDGWYRLVMFNSSNELLNDLSYAEKSNLVFYLRRHPNIISKLSDRERRSANENMKPFVYKWVSEEEKLSLGIGANYFKNINEEVLNYIQTSKQFNDMSFVDILSVLEYLFSCGAGKWIDTSTLNIGVRSGVLIENVRYALNELLKLRLVVLAFQEGSYRKGKWKQFVRLTLNAEEYNNALQGTDIDAVKIVGAKSALQEDFQFTVLEYFYSLQNSDFDFEQVEPTVVQTETEPKIDLFQPAEVQKNIPETKPATKAEVSPQIAQIAEDIKHYMNSFVGIAESIYKHEDKKIEALNNIIQMSNQKQQEIDDLKNQTATLKKMLSQRDKDKHQMLKTVQDTLNMMMGQIITTTDNFANIPRHQLDERDLAKYKTDVIKISVQAASDIQNLFTTSGAR